jgi:imidazolonepropionase-like amidohydrolase
MECVNIIEAVGGYMALGDSAVVVAHIGKLKTRKVGQCDICEFEAGDLLAIIQSLNKLGLDVKIHCSSL